MTKLSPTTFQIQQWDESPLEYGERHGVRLTRARVLQNYSGGMSGIGQVEYLMTHRADGTASFVGVEWFEGTLDGRSGTLTLQHSGTFEGGVARGSCCIVEGASTGELVGITGEGAFAAEGREVPFSFEYQRAGE